VAELAELADLAPRGAPRTTRWVRGAEGFHPHPRSFSQREKDAWAVAASPFGARNERGATVRCLWLRETRSRGQCPRLILAALVRDPEESCYAVFKCWGQTAKWFQLHHLWAACDLSTPKFGNDIVICVIIVTAIARKMTVVTQMTHHLNA
jgi:hypothetical protein